MKFHKLIFFFFIVIFLIGCIVSKSIAGNEKLSAPNNLVAWQSGEYIQLRYDFDYEEQYEYNIYRSPNLGAEWEKLNFIPFPLNSFVDYNPLVYETSYYKVVRIDYYGNESFPSVIKVQYDLTKIGIYIKGIFDKNNIISDQQLINFSSMSLWDIQNFLSNHGSYLATYYFDGRSAAQHIYDACQEHQISPQVVLTTLQKEQGLITSSTATQPQLDFAMGWDGSSDFGTQIYWGTKQFRRYYDDLESYGWSVGEPHTVYDGVITPANIATAGLYIYTPWIGGGGGGEPGVGGNFLFWDIWYNNFGFNGTTSLAPPPEHVYPLNNSTIYTTTPTFEWNSVSTADGYGLYIRDIASGEMVYETGEQPLYGTSLELPGGILEDGRSYWWNMNSYNSAGWNPDCSIHWKFTVQIDNYPTVNSFIVNPISITLGDSFDISYSVSDDVGLSWVELWRTNDKNGQPDENGWTQIGPQYSISGKSYSGEFHDSPSLFGIYWYGIHVGDTAGNWSVEPKPPGPIMVTVNNPTVNPPTGVQATDGTYTDKVRITWNSVSGASYYHVYRATSSGGSKTSLGSWQSSTSYDDISVIPGQTYYYFVKAATSSSGSNASDYSTYNEGWRKLSPPTGINATDGNYTDRVRITWDNVSGASYYHVYRAITSSGSKTPLGSWQGSTTYDDTSATPGQTYYYFVKAAINSSGYRESDYSSYNTGFCSLPLTRIIRLGGDLNFGNVQVGDSPQRTLTIYNDGNSTLTVSSISYPTSFSGNWSGDIFAGGSQNITVTFSPTQPIIYSGTLTVNSDKTSGDNTKSVSGTGVPSTYSPQVTTKNASNITSTSAQLNGNLDSIGNLICQVWFEYGKTTSYGISTTKQSKSSVGPFNETISSLDPNTTYHFKACASNSEGTVYGADEIFTTPMFGDFGSANNGPPDCKVDFEDLMIFALAYGSTPADANWNPLCDIYPNDKIDFEDLMVFAMHYGETCAD